MTVEDRTKTQTFLYRGHRVLGRLFTLEPLVLFLALSIPSTVLLFVPAWILGIHLISLRTDSGLRSVGLLQNLNWSLMFPLVLPFLFGGMAWVSNQMRESVEDLTHPEVDVIKARSAEAGDYVQAFSDELARSGKVLILFAVTLTVLFSVVDLSALMRGSYLWFSNQSLHPGVPGYPFKEADTDWTVAFTFVHSRYSALGFATANLAFDSLAYLIQGFTIFLGLFWVGKFWLFIRTFVALIAEPGAPYEFDPMRRDFHQRLGLDGIGRLFNYFSSFLLIFQSYVFLHRLQIIARDGGMSVIEFLRVVFESSKNLKNPFQRAAAFRNYSTLENLGMWLLLIVTTIVILWTLKLMLNLKTYIEARKETLWTQYRRELTKAQLDGAVTDIISLQGDMKELRESTAWVNGDNAGPRFVVALLILAIVGWLPPILAYAAPVGVLTYLFPPLKSLGGRG